MSTFLLILFFWWILLRGLPAQDYRFIRQDGVYRLIEPRETIVLVPPVDTRPIWLRALRSIRPWIRASPNYRLEYNYETNLYQLDGAIGVGIRGQVEF